MRARTCTCVEYVSGGLVGTMCMWWGRGAFVCSACWCSISRMPFDLAAPRTPNRDTRVRDEIGTPPLALAPPESRESASRPRAPTVDRHYKTITWPLGSRPPRRRRRRRRHLDLLPHARRRRRQARPSRRRRLHSLRSPMITTTSTSTTRRPVRERTVPTSRRQNQSTANATNATNATAASRKRPRCQARRWVQAKPRAVWWWCSAACSAACTRRSASRRRSYCWAASPSSSARSSAASRSAYAASSTRVVAAAVGGGTGSVCAWWRTRPISRWPRADNLSDFTSTSSTFTWLWV